MFLRATKRKKDGKIHHYWSVVENVRVGRRVFQRRALHLGELNDSQHAEWQRAIEAIDENGRVTQLKLFPEERAPASGVRCGLAFNFGICWNWMTSGQVASTKAEKEQTGPRYSKPLSSIGLLRPEANYRCMNDGSRIARQRSFSGLAC